MSKTVRPAGTTGEVFKAFLILGLTSFGGPIAHLGYFRTEFVERRRWLTEQAYADLVALCQFLPGPASSQVGFALGLTRAGYLGALAAWIAFTLPSAMILVLFAMGANIFDSTIAQGIVHGLKITAVAIVAHAVLGMARNLCPDHQRTGIALGAVVTVVFISGPLGQVAAILVGAFAGLILCRQGGVQQKHDLVLPVSSNSGYVAAFIFTLFLLGLPVIAWVSPSPSVALMDSFYRAGALVFGGGHVVLPLLEAETVQSGWISADEFLTGYGITQAVPGPLFTFAAYLGALMEPMHSKLLGAGLALVMIFLPGLLLLIAIVPHWNKFRRWKGAQSLMHGANAAVVGILGAALYQPVWSSTIHKPFEFVLALTGFLLLTVWKFPAWAVVLILALGGVLISL